MAILKHQVSGLCLIFIIVVEISLLFSEPVYSQSLTGYEIAQKVFDRDRGDTSTSLATMVLINKNDKKKVRTFTTLRRLENGLEKNLIRFTSPADIDGTGFLTIEKEGYETDQFLYLPALRRTRRIVSSQKSNRFVNSDFTYEDMERHPVEDYDYSLLSDKAYLNIECYQLKTQPKKGVESQYSAKVSLIAKQSFVPVHVRYYDKKENHIKTYKVAKLELKDNIWTEMMIVMEDLKRQHKTYIRVDKIEYNIEIQSDQVSKTALEKY